MKALLLFILCLSCSGCFRPELRELEVVYAEKTPQELTPLREALLQEEKMLPDHKPFYESVELLSQPTRIRIRYYSSRLAQKNIEQKLIDAGFPPSES